MMLALMGSSESCRYCTYLTEVPPPPAGPEDEHDAAVRAAEEIIDQAKH